MSSDREPTTQPESALGLAILSVLEDGLGMPTDLKISTDSLAAVLRETVVSLGWRPPAQVIETPEDLDTLPNETVILDANEEFHCLNPYGVDRDRVWFPAWLSGNASATDFGQAPKLPAVVVSSPTEKAGQ